ncbi:MAG: UDP-N-acetylglucosamine 2-epimerase (non-hydrolyzing) [Actinomycetota bacterium]|jgi:UDP-GlcNAc3NAcA epimerase|nr:UDP-N-acetylglucosamine 2-epimerase (non-hydrolyzing) [Actinomycetota bacterium]
MKVISIVGARPQFIKAAPVCAALRTQHEELLVHSGQHYDYNMSDVFFEQLGIPRPDFNLGVGSGTHGQQTAEMLVLLEELFTEQKPDVVLVYGDTNTTLAGGLAAAKLNIPVAHVEAGLRSFNRTMPEEVNRVLVDHLSDILLCPTRTAVANLEAEGIADGVVLVGDVMLDTARHFADVAEAAEAVERMGLEPGGYYLATVHRAGNSDSETNLRAIVEAFASADKPVIWAIHPRTAKNIGTFGLQTRLDSADNIQTVPPVSYVETVGLLRNAAALLTDSGGMQKEAYFFGVPCVTLREETEWTETVELGWNRLVGADTARILDAIGSLEKPEAHPDVYGDGHAAEAILAALNARYGARS